MNRKIVLTGFLAAGLLVNSTVIAVEPDNNTVDGNATYFSTGKIVPSTIKFNGYDVRDSDADATNGIQPTLYVDVTLASSDGTTALPSTLPYSIDVVNNSTSLTLLNTLYTGSLTGGTSSVSKKDIEITLNSALPKDHRIVVEVDND